MPTSRRVARVAELVKREVSQMLLYGLKDDRVGVGMVSICGSVWRLTACQNLCQHLWHG